jgi:hypothetical protein
MKIILAVSFAAALLSGASLTSVVQPTPAPTRTILEQPNVPIASRLLPGDEFVVIARPNVGIFVNTTVPDVSEDLDLRARVSDLIVVAELVGSEAFLSENDSWIRTRRTFRPLRVVKDAKKVISEASPLLTVYHGGGEAKINGVLVRAGYFYAYEAGRKYLLFLRSFSQDNNATVGVQLAIDRDNKIAPMEFVDGRSRSDTSRLHGLDLDVIIAEISQRLRAMPVH